MHIKFKLIAVFILMVIAMFHSRNIKAADIEAKLSSADGSTEFAVQDSGANNMAEIDSDGNLLIKGTATIEGDMKGAYVQTGSNELLAHHIIRHTVNSDEESDGSFNETWDIATATQIVSMDVSIKTGALFYFAQYDDQNDYGGLICNFAGTYDGTTIRIKDNQGNMVETDVVTIYIVYEKP